MAGFSTRYTVAAAAVCGLLCLALIVCVWWTGPVPQIVFGHDVMVLLEGGWKWKWGFRPHTDYYSPFGALTFLLVALGIDLTGSLVQALPAATCIVAALALPMALYGTFSRLHPIAAFAATILLIAAAVTPHELRFDSTVWSYAAVYNRWAYALFGVAIVTIALRPTMAWSRRDWADGLIAGACVMSLIFLKISYGLLAAAIFIGFAPFRRRSAGYWLGALLSGVLVVLFVGLLLRWGFSLLLADMQIASKARHGLDAAQFLKWAGSLRSDLVALSSLAALWFICGVVFGRAAIICRFINALLLLGGFGVSAAAILMTNSPLGGLQESPVTGLGALVFLGGILSDCWNKRLTEDWRRVAVAVVTCAAAAALALFVVAPVTGRDLKSISEAARFKANKSSLLPLETFQTGPLQGLQIKDFGGDPPLPTTYVGKVNDGLELLARTGNSHRSVAALDFANAFNVARGVKASRTAPTVWQLGFVFSATSAPALDRVFNGEDVIMIPVRFGDGNQGNITVIRQLYGAYLDERYVLAGESEQWQLLVPK
ncbi:MAG: hypothetical protein ABR526_11235 [Chthoniobacterales bacterium]